jgi:hypothetical protein
MIYVGRESVADVDHGMKFGEAVQHLRFPHTGRECEMFTQDAAAQGPRHKQPIAGPGSAAGHRTTPGRLANERD